MRTSKKIKSNICNSLCQIIEGNLAGASIGEHEQGLRDQRQGRRVRGAARLAAPTQMAAAMAGPGELDGDGPTRA